MARRRSWPLRLPWLASSNCEASRRTATVSSTCWPVSRRKLCKKPPVGPRANCWRARHFPLGSSTRPPSPPAAASSFSIWFSKVFSCWSAFFDHFWINFCVPGVPVPSYESIYGFHVGGGGKNNNVGPAPANCDLPLWLAVQSAILCVNSKLRTPLGKAQDTFLTVEDAREILTFCFCLTDLSRRSLEEDLLVEEKVYDTINLGRRIDVLWPSPTIRNRGRKFYWKSWLPEVGMEGLVNSATGCFINFLFC